VTGEDIRVEHDGLTFRCRLDGPEEGAPWVVFSNSMLTDVAVWDAQVAALSDRYRILRYDQRGHGETSVPPAPCTFDQLGGDVVALMNHFGVSSCTFVGLSMGVPTGLHLVSHHPERVEKLVLSDGQLATAEGGAATWEDRITAAYRLGMGGLADLTMERWFGAAFLEAGKAKKVRDVAASMPLEGYVACARALQGYDFNDVLAQIAVPTLIMAGANDGNMPVSMRRLCEAIPGAIMHVIPDAGHIPSHEQPEIFNRHLLDFLG
jgi:3-oxoadipate enol-lactonase